VKKGLLQRAADISWLLYAQGLDSHGLGNLGKVEVLETGAEIRKSSNHHFEFHHAKPAVVEDSDFDRQVVQGKGKEVSHQHAETAIAAESHNLPLGVQELRSNRLWQCVGHRAVLEGSEQAASLPHSQVSSRPDGAHAGSAVKMASPAAASFTHEARYYGWTGFTFSAAITCEFIFAIVSLQ